MKPSISVDIRCVVPTHNRFEALDRCLGSILSQTCTPSEVFVVDDVGNSDVQALVESFQRPFTKVQYVDHSNSGGKSAGSSRNAGALGATSRHLAFLDDDDYWMPTYLEKMLIRQAVTDADIVIAWGSLERDGRVTRGNWHIEDNVGLAEAYGSNPGFTGSNFIARTSLFESVGGFDASLWVYNDIDFLVRALEAAAEVAIVREELVVQTASAADHLSSRSDRRALGIAAYIAKHSDNLSPQQRRKLERDQALARMHRAQMPSVYLASFAKVLTHSTAVQWRDAAVRRIRRQRGYN